MQTGLPSLFITVQMAAILCASQLPSADLDIVLGLEAKSKLLEHHFIIKTGTSAETALDVFDELLGTSPIKLSRLPYAWEIAILSGNEVNAYATAGGHVYVHDGLARILGNKRSLWAAVIGHELAHTAKRHHVAAYLRALELQENYLARKAYYQKRAAQGDSSAQWALVGLEIGKVAANLINLKLDRNQEHEADLTGMLMMAEAGYHPAFIFALQHTVRLHTGDSSKFKAFFSGHPRWATRAKRSHKFYEQAERLFEARWPVAALSPGGVPPPIVFLEKPRTKTDKKSGRAEIKIPMRLEESRGQTLMAVAWLFHKGKRVLAGTPEYRDGNGLFLAHRFLQAPALEGSVSSQSISPVEGSTQQLEFLIPSQAVLQRKRKLKSMVCVIGLDGLILNCTSEFSVVIPKARD